MLNTMQHSHARDKQIKNFYFSASREMSLLTTFCRREDVRPDGETVGSVVVCGSRCHGVATIARARKHVVDARERRLSSSSVADG